MEIAKTNDGQSAAERKVCKRCRKPIRTEAEYCYRCRLVQNRWKAFESRDGSSERRNYNSAREQRKQDLEAMQRCREGVKRRCHDCGKPTSNYRCEDCWQKLRVKHGLNQSGEVNVAEGWE